MDWRERLGSRQKHECSDGSSRKSRLDLSVREEEGQKLRRDEKGGKQRTFPPSSKQETTDHRNQEMKAFTAERA